MIEFLSKRLNLFFVVFSFATSLKAQISTHEEPVTMQFSNSGVTSLHKMKEIDLIQMPLFDSIKIANEDRLGDKNDAPFRFGYAFPVNLNLKNSGTWDTLPNGTRIWRLRIHLSGGAKGVSLVYNHFYIPQDGKFFIYSENKKQTLGAFTSLNNKGGVGENSLGFATSLIFGNNLVLEYVAPKSVKENAVININYVVHVYRSFLTPDSFTGTPNDKGFPPGQSSPCENNINCPVGSSYQNEKRAVAVWVLPISQNNASACTGTLIQNTARDATPYFLTANHCLNNNSYDANGQTNMSTALFYWNYESATCNTVVPNAIGTTGANLLANSKTTDFALLKLIEDPKQVSGVNPYYLDWSRSTQGATSAVIIHHPAADIKKISFDNLTPVSSYGSSINWDDGVTTTANTHWAVVFDNGTSEKGSSGSALLNQNHLIIGQDHGGSSLCNPTSGTSYFGRFDLSWSGDGTPQRSLKSWLDPLGTNPLTSFPVSISGPSSLCNSATYTALGVPSGQTVTWSLLPATANAYLSINGNQVTVNNSTQGTITLTLVATLNGPSASIPISASSNSLVGTYSNGSTNGTINTFNFVPTGYTYGYFNWPNVTSISVSGLGSGSSFYWNGGSSFSFYLSAGQNMTVKFNGLSSCGSTSPVNIMATRTFQASSSFSLAVSPNPSSTKLSLSITNQPDTTGKLMMAQKAATNATAELSSTNSTKVLLYDLSSGTLVKTWNFSENVSSNYSLDVSGLKKGYYVLKMSRDNQTVSTNIQIQ